MVICLFSRFSERGSSRGTGLHNKKAGLQYKKPGLQYKKLVCSTTPCSLLKSERGACALRLQTFNTCPPRRTGGSNTFSRLPRSFYALLCSAQECFGESVHVFNLETHDGALSLKKLPDAAPPVE